MSIQHLVLPALVSDTPFGKKYTVTLNYRLLDDYDLNLISNKETQRAVNTKRAEKMARDYFNILTKGSADEHTIPFQSSFVFNMELDKHSISEEELYVDGQLNIPIVERLLTIRDGGHRKACSYYLIQRLQYLIDNAKTKRTKTFYEAILHKFLDVSFTADIYVNLDQNFGKRCLLDLGKSEPVSKGREFYFVYDDFVRVIEFLANKENLQVTIDLDNDIYSKYEGLSVPLNYVSGIVKNIGKALFFQSKTVDEVNSYIISFLSDILLNLDIEEFVIKEKGGEVSFEYLSNCKVNYFKTIERLIRNEFEVMKKKIIKDGLGLECNYSQLNTVDKKTLIESAEKVDLIERFEGIKELVLTKNFKENLSQFSPNKREAAEA
ncbi:hypothetical protein [Bacillus cereus]